MGTFMPRSIPLRRSRHRSRGQSLAEFAIVFPIFMLVIGGIVQLGILFWGQNSLNQVVRDAGRYAVTEPDCAPFVADVQTKIVDLSRQMGVATITASSVTMPTNGEMVGTPPVADPVSTTSVPGVNCPAKTNVDHVWVRITVKAQVPIFFPVVPGGGAISSTALFRMEPIP
jgi:Flp pilus assembly protein TadG